MRQSKFTEPTVRLDLRLPKSLHGQMRQRAIDEGRSLNAEIIQALKKHLSLPPR